MRKFGILAVALAAMALGSCGEAPQKSGSAPPAPEASAPPPAADGAPAPQAEAPPLDETAPSAGAPAPGSPPAAEAERPKLGAPRSAEPSAAPAGPDASGGSPAPEATDAPEPAPAPQPTPAPVPSPGAPPAEKKVQGEWDVVPVFFGTDRARKANDERLDYGSERGRRLELGAALVTVPKIHQVPSIERPWSIRMFNVTLYEEAEDPNRHFTMDEIGSLSEEEFLAAVRARLSQSARYKNHAFIFVHGYNTSFDYAIYRTAQISYDLKFDGAAFAYSWPSGGGLSSYTYDRESSGQAEPYLRQFMELVINKTGAQSVSIIAHSMGNLPVLEVLRDLRRAKPDGVQISQIILAAPDVDRDNFENIASEIKGIATGVTLYAASNDRALTVSRNFFGGVPRAGDVPATGPLILPGIDTIDVSAASMDSLGLNHSGYAENNALLKDIAALVETGMRPPKLRTPSLEEIETDKGPYWRYPTGGR